MCMLDTNPPYELFVQMDGGHGSGSHNKFKRLKRPPTWSQSPQTLSLSSFSFNIHHHSLIYSTCNVLLGLGRPHRQQQLSQEQYIPASMLIVMLIVGDMVVTMVMVRVIIIVQIGWAVQVTIWPMLIMIMMTKLMMVWCWSLRVFRISFAARVGTFIQI